MTSGRAQILMAAESGLVTLFSNQLSGRLRGWGTGNVFMVCLAVKIIKDALPAAKIRYDWMVCVFLKIN